jgi:hypothetical protein
MILSPSSLDRISEVSSVSKFVNFLTRRLSLVMEHPSMVIPFPLSTRLFFVLTFFVSLLWSGNCNVHEVNSEGFIVRDAGERSTMKSAKYPHWNRLLVKLTNAWHDFRLDIIDITHSTDVDDLVK